MFTSNFLASGWTQAMSSNEQISVAQLSRLVGLPDAPAIVDVRIDEDVAADPLLLPGSVRRDYRTVADLSLIHIFFDLLRTPPKTHRRCGCPIWRGPPGQ